MYWYAPWVFFWGRQCAFVFPIYVRKYRKYTTDRWIVMYTECPSALISPLRQWLDSYAKNRLKMWHTFKHFIYMQYFLLPRKFEWNFIHVIFKEILVIDDWGISGEIALTWKPQDLTDDKSTLVQVMAWCRQATSHYLSQCRPSSLSHMASLGLNELNVEELSWVHCTISVCAKKCRLPSNI